MHLLSKYLLVPLLGITFVFAVPPALNVYVIPFDNTKNEPALGWLSDAFSDMITANLLEALRKLNSKAIIIICSTSEVYGNVVMEAMACGVPVVAYNRGGPGELVKSGHTGWLVPPDDIEQLKMAVSKIDQIDRNNFK